MCSLSLNWRQYCRNKGSDEGFCGRQAPLWCHHFSYITKNSGGCISRYKNCCRRVHTCDEVMTAVHSRVSRFKWLSWRKGLLSPSSTIKKKVSLVSSSHHNRKRIGGNNILKFWTILTDYSQVLSCNTRQDRYVSWCLSPINHMP